MFGAFPIFKTAFSVMDYTRPHREAPDRMDTGLPFRTGGFIFYSFHPFSLHFVFFVFSSLFRILFYYFHLRLAPLLNR